MDRGTWGATVHGVTKSRTLLSDFHFSSYPQGQKTKQSKTNTPNSLNVVQRILQDKISSDNSRQKFKKFGISNKKVRLQVFCKASQSPQLKTKFQLHTVGTCCYHSFSQLALLSFLISLSPNQISISWGHFLNKLPAFKKKK